MFIILLDIWKLILKKESIINIKIYKKEWISFFYFAIGNRWFIVKDIKNISI